MTDLVDSVPVRATLLAANGSDATVVVLHREDQLFDLLGFNQGYPLPFRAVPAESVRGMAWSALAGQGERLVDRGVLEAKAVQMYNGEASDIILAPADLGSFQAIDCSVGLPGQPDAADDPQRIENAISAFPRRRLFARLDETLEIPPLPAAAQRILALKSDPDYSLQDLVKVVETDPSIAARVMAWASSAFYAANPAPRSLADAIMRVLGFDLVMNLALGLALAGTLRLPAHQVRGVPPFWTEAVFTAAAMEALARRGDARTRASAGLSYLTGLLSNYGTLVTGHVFPPQYANICLLQEANPQLPAWMIDEHVLGLSREVLAAALLDQWELPEATTTAIRHQYDPHYAGDHERDVRLLQTARALLGYSSVSGNLLADERLDVIGLETGDLDDVETLLTESRDALDGLARAVA